MGKQLVSFITCESSAPFLAHLAKGHVSFCHHLASIVRRKLSHLKISQKNPEYMLNYPFPRSCSKNLSSFRFIIKQQ
jgi:hypothetical protein